MTTLCVPSDIEALGFVAEQFGQEDGDFDDYLQGVIDEAEAEIILDCGSQTNFAAFLNDPVNGTQNTVLMKKGEKKLVAAELWSRRLISLDTMAVNARSETWPQMQKVAQANAQNSEADAWEFIGAVTGDQESGTFTASGSIETGNYRPISTS
jgi:hypothetical protein